MRSVHAIRAAGAALLATSTIVAAPPLPNAVTAQAARDVHLAAATAAIAPSDFYRHILTETANNAGDLWQLFATQPFPIAEVVAGNQTAFVRDFVATVGGVLRGEYPLTELLAPVSDEIATASRNVVTVAAGLVAALPTLAVSVVLPVVSTVVSAAFAIADIVRAVVDLDVVGLVEAIANVPGWIVNGFLNGTVIPNEAVPLAIPGVLTSENAFLATGPVATAIERTQHVADQMSRYPSAAPAEPDGVGDDADPAGEDAATSPTGEDVDTPAEDLQDLGTASHLDGLDADRAAPAEPTPETAETAETALSDEDVESSEPTVAGGGKPDEISTRRAAGTIRTEAPAATPEANPPRSPDDRTQ